MDKQSGWLPYYGCRILRLYNQKRPHTALADRTPAEFAETLSSRPFAFQILDKADPQRCQGSAAARQKTPALDTATDLPSDTERKAKGLFERPVLLERLN
jgi:hypothetical protein